MRTLITVPMLAAAAVAAPAFAQATDTATGEVAVTGDVTPLCLLGAPSQAVVDLGNMVDTSGSRVGRVRAIGDQTGTLPASFCNYAGSVLTVDATALVETAGPPPRRPPALPAR